MLRLAGWLTAALLVACTSGPPGESPPGSPSTSPSPAQLASTSLTPPSPSPQPSPGSVHDVLLRMHRTGGFLYPGAALDVAPSFTLYGDGSVIYLPSDAPAFGAAGPGGGLRRAEMNQEQVDALIDFALGEGGLAEAGERYDDVPIADSVTVNFIIDASGVRKTVSVYALGDESEPGPETAHRERFKLLAATLGGFDNEIARGNAADAGGFEPAAYRVTIFPDEFGEIPPTAEWPWDDLAPEDFPRDQSGFGVGILTPDQAGPLFDLPPSPDLGEPVVIGPDDVSYLIRYRPLLPDEMPEKAI